jgi:hypothetical protein
MINDQTSSPSTNVRVPQAIGDHGPDRFVLPIGLVERELERVADLRAPVCLLERVRGVREVVGVERHVAVGPKQVPAMDRVDLQLGRFD